MWWNESQWEWNSRLWSHKKIRKSLTNKETDTKAKEGRGGRRKRKNMKRAGEWEKNQREGWERNRQIRWKKVLWEITKEMIDGKEELGRIERAMMFIRKSKVTFKSFNIHFFYIDIHFFWKHVLDQYALESDQLLPVKVIPVVWTSNSPTGHSM